MASISGTLVSSITLSGSLTCLNIESTGSINIATGQTYNINGTTVLKTTPTINMQVFSTAGSATYTPSTNMIYCVVELVGAGGGGGGGAPCTSTTVSCGAGGGAGQYIRATVLASTISSIGGSVSITIGSGGSAGSNSFGSTGGSTYFGAYGATSASTLFLGCNGGYGGGAISATSTFWAPNPGTGGYGGTTTGIKGTPLNSNGNSGTFGFCMYSSSTVAYSIGGKGADSPIGSGGVGASAALTGTGVGSSNTGEKGYRGGGGGGSATVCNTTTPSGGKGGDGCIIITEYIA
jgi:hypothetical protein